MSDQKYTERVVNVPPATQRHFANGSWLSFASLGLYALNRLYAWWSSVINYLNYGLLYLFLGGVPPTYHTRPRPKYGYTPAVFVTGAHDGIGRSIAFTLAESGYAVFAGVKNAEDIEDLNLRFEEYRNALRASPTGTQILGSLTPVVCDVHDPSSIQSAVRAVTNAIASDWKAKPFVSVVNVAGFCMVSPMELTSREDILRMMNLDLMAYIDVTKAFFPLLKRFQGRVVNVGSFGGFAPVPGWTTYNAVKSGIENLTRAWSLETSRTHGIRMATVRPGFVATAGIGPKIAQAIASYESSDTAIGFDSLGNALLPDAQPRSDDEKADVQSAGEYPSASAGRPNAWRDYEKMMRRNREMVELSMELGTPAVNVGKTVRDALTEPWMQPVYTVGVDALLGQMARDLLPEPLYEWAVLKVFT